MTDHDTGSLLTRSITGKPLEALTPDEEGRRRRRNLRILGVVLLLGFVLPVFDDRGKMDFVNFQPFRSQARELESDYSEEYGFRLRMFGLTPFDAALPLLWPGIAGAVLLVACLPVVRSRVRAWWIVGLGTLPFLMGMFTNPMFRDEAMRDLWRLPQAFFVIMAFLAAGWVSVFAGARVRVHRPERDTAYLVGVVGACLYLFAFLVPSLPKDAGYVLIAAPFKLLADEKGRWFGLALVFQMLLLLGACGASIGNVPKVPRSQARGVARLTFLLLMLGTFGGAAALLLVLVIRDPWEVHWLALFGNVVKFGAWFVGLLLLLPVGITDLMVEGPATSERAPSVETPTGTA